MDFCSTLSFVGPAPGIVKFKEYKNQTQLGNQLMSVFKLQGGSAQDKHRPCALAVFVQTDLSLFYLEGDSSEVFSLFIYIGPQIGHS